MEHTSELCHPLLRKLRYLYFYANLLLTEGCFWLYNSQSFPASPRLMLLRQVVSSAFSKMRLECTAMLTTEVTRIRYH